MAPKKKVVKEEQPVTPATTPKDELSTRVQTAMTTIRNHKVFKHIDKAAPLGINRASGKKSGFKEPYEHDKYMDSMAARENTKPGLTSCTSRTRIRPPQGCPSSWHGWRHS